MAIHRWNLGHSLGALPKSDGRYVTFADHDVEFRRWKDALRKLVAKLDAMEKSINDCIMFSTLHGGPYTGPQWIEEMAEARALLAEEKGEPYK